MTRDLRRTLLALLVAAAFAAPAAAQVRVIPAPGLLGGTGPALAADAEGLLAAAYFDDFRLQRIDRSLALVGEQASLPAPRPFAKIFHQELLAQDEGFLLVSEDQVISLLATPLSAGGAAEGPPVDLGGNTIFGVGAAHNDGATVVTYGSIFPNPWAWVRPVDDAATPLADWRRIAPKWAASPFNVLVGDVLQVPVAEIGDSFFAAWIDAASGLFVKDVDRDGVPRGGAPLLVPLEECPHHVDVAALGGLERLVYSAGCDARSLSLVSRAPGAESASDPVSLALLPPAESTSEKRVLDLASVDGRLGLLYLARRADGSEGWIYAELDGSGALLAGPLDLEGDFGAVDVRGAAIDADPFAGRFVVSWTGGGAEGPGLYVVNP